MAGAVVDLANFIFVILSVGSKNPSGFYVDPEYTLLELNILKEKILIV